MAPQSTSSIKQKAVAALLSLAAMRPFAEINLADIAQEAGLSLTALHGEITCLPELLSAWSLQVDEAMMRGIDSPRREDSPRDRLFELLMARFDALHEQRAAAQSILRGLRVNPPLALGTLPLLARSMHWTLEAAGLATSTPKGGLMLAGLTALYLKTLHVWLDDDSTDLSRTMAELDKNLAQAASWAERLRF